MFIYSNKVSKFEYCETIAKSSYDKPNSYLDTVAFMKISIFA